MRDIDYSGLPEGLRDGMRNYIEESLPAGHFLTAVLSNNLTEAFGRADALNIVLMHSIVQWVYNEAPSTCWGSPEKVRAWLMPRGEDE